VESAEIQAIAEQAQRKSEVLRKIQQEIHRVIVGQERLVQRLLIALLTDGHVLLEGVPGLAKTLAVRTLAQTISASFSRIQFTPDLLPSDLVGTVVYNQQANQFYIRRGPIFANIVLADEINRAPAKVQSALLEAMQERQVTIGDETLPLPAPFLVLATQNPIEQEGTYPLPEAQVDRFMLKVIVNYPSAREEREIVRLMTAPEEPTARTVADLEDIVEAKRIVKNIYVDERIVSYVVDLVTATRSPYLTGPQGGPLVEYGASPRASIWLVAAARARAFLEGRGFVTPEDIKDLAPDILRHRIIVTFEAEAEGISSEDVIQKVLTSVRVP